MAFVACLSGWSAPGIDRRQLPSIWRLTETTRKAGPRGRRYPRSFIHADTWAGSRAWCTAPAKSSRIESRSTSSFSRGRERGDGPVGVVPGPVEPAVDHVLHPAAISEPLATVSTRRTGPKETVIPLLPRLVQEALKGQGRTGGTRDPSSPRADAGPQIIPRPHGAGLRQAHRSPSAAPTAPPLSCHGWHSWLPSPEPPVL